MKRFTYFLIIMALFLACANKVEVPSYDGSSMLVYSNPAKDWEQESLPLGNGFIGASTFGGVTEEKFVLNEKTLWEGGPGEFEKYNGGNSQEGHLYLEKIRQLISEKKFSEANKLAEKFLTGNPTGFGSYQPLGELYIKFPKLTCGSKKYKRTLNLNDGVQSVEFYQNDLLYTREFFASYPDNVIAGKLSCSKPKKMSAVLYFKGVKQCKNYYDTTGGYEKLHDKKVKGRTETVKAEKLDNSSALLKVTGKINSNNMEYEAIFKVDVKNGTIKINKNKIEIENADDIYFYYLASTDYLNEYPKYKGNDYKSANQTTLNNMKGKNYATILKDHIEDYRAIYGKSNIKLSEVGLSKEYTDVRLRKFQDNEDPNFVELFVNYAKYLLISASRDGSLPINLQGIWNNSVTPPWQSDYHTNINLQMAYWPAEVLNLEETHIPLIQYIETLVAPGKITAKQYYGTTSGWVVNTSNNPFGYTAPGHHPVWGHFPGGAAWLCQHIWKHYNFSQDKEFLAKYYPPMKEAALFWSEWLIKDKSGRLTSSPSYSPEHGTISEGATMDLQIANEIFTNTIAAAKILKIDADLQKTLQDKLDNLAPLKIGKHGQLQEWAEDIDDPNNKHRHVSHLYGLHPGNQIDVEKTPKLADAAKTTLKHRGDDGTGWSIAWKTNFHARLRDADKAYSLVKRLFNLTTGKTVKMNFAGGLYKNLFDAHPPFQIDGNFGAASGIAEMLLQSQTGDVVILPALPKQWKTGSFSGLKAEGGFTVGAEWRDGKLVKATVGSKIVKDLVVKYKDKTYTRRMKKGEEIVLGPNLEFISTNKEVPNGGIYEMFIVDNDKDKTKTEKE